MISSSFPMNQPALESGPPGRIGLVTNTNRLPIGKDSLWGDLYEKRFCMSSAKAEGKNSGKMLFEKFVLKGETRKQVGKRKGAPFAPFLVMGLLAGAHILSYPFSIPARRLAMFFRLLRSDSRRMVRRWA
jgi:hypothetical protein